MITIPYVPIGPDDEFEFASGKILIKYDPVQEWSPPVVVDGCNIQMAAIELWVESHSLPRFKSVWIVFPHQVPGYVPPVDQSIQIEGGNVRVFGNEKAPTSEGVDWKEYEALKGRAFCARPSSGASVSSALSASSSSTTQDPTTLQTSVSRSSSADSTTFSSMPISSSASPSSATPAPAPTPSKAISIALIRPGMGGTAVPNYWVIFKTAYGSQANVCSSRTVSHDAWGTRFAYSNAIDSPPWPHLSFIFTLYGEDDCRYFNDGNGPGSLTCPHWNGKVIDCVEDPERTQKSATHRCDNRSRSYHRAVTCEW
jgi:hypothetical protein